MRPTPLCARLRLASCNACGQVLSLVIVNLDDELLTQNNVRSGSPRLVPRLRSRTKKMRLAAPVICSYRPPVFRHSSGYSFWCLRLFYPCKRLSTFCFEALACASIAVEARCKIWFFASAVVSSAKSASSIPPLAADRLAEILVRLLTV